MGLSTLVTANSPPTEARIRSFVVSGIPDARIETLAFSALSAWTGTPSLIVLEPPLDIDVQDAVGAVAARFPSVPLAVLGRSTQEAVVDAALRAGALSYLPACYTSEQAGLVLRLTLQGIGHRPNLLHARAAAPLRSEAGSDEQFPDASARQYHLTPRQIEVLAHAVEGLSNKQIAARLEVTEGVIRLHMSEIYRRLGVERRAEAIVKALRMKEVVRALVGHGENGKDVLDWLLPHFTHRQLRAGDVIFRKGDMGREMYYLQRGNVVLEEIGVQMKPGDLFGEIGVFAPDRSRTCTARCATDVDLFCLDSEKVKRIYYLNPQFALHVVTLLARHLIADRDRIH